MGTSDGTNINILRDPTICQLASYVKTPGIFKCAADKSVGVRSMSMNSAVGTRWYGEVAGVQKGSRAVHGGWLTGSYNEAQGTQPNGFRTYGKLASIILPGPANLWVLMDEHPDSINDSSMATPAVYDILVDWPASYHNGAAGVAFADGHSEVHRWRNKDTLLPIKGIYNSVPAAPFPSPNNQDTRWLADRSSAHN